MHTLDEEWDQRLAAALFFQQGAVQRSSLPRCNTLRKTVIGNVLSCNKTLYQTAKKETSETCNCESQKVRHEMGLTQYFLNI